MWNFQTFQIKQVKEQKQKKNHFLVLRHLVRHNHNSSLAPYSWYERLTFNKNTFIASLHWAFCALLHMGFWVRAGSFSLTLTLSPAMLFDGYVNIFIFKAYLHETLIITCARAIYTFRRFATWLLHTIPFMNECLIAGIRRRMRECNIGNRHGKERKRTLVKEYEKIFWM